MPRITTTMTVRLSGTLRDFVAQNVSDDGAYESVSEYLRDLILTPLPPGAVSTAHERPYGCALHAYDKA
jgi:hypothetical protein